MKVTMLHGYYYNVFAVKIYMFICENPDATVRQIAKQIGIETTPTRRVCELLRKEGHIARRTERWWNGMHYVDRWHYFSK